MEFAAEDIVLTYFPIEGVAEKVRLALSVAGVPFQDVRVSFPEFAKMKADLPNGQLPVMTIRGKEISQSDAMVRWAARQGDGALYPVDDVNKCLDIDIVLGILADDARAFGPALYAGMLPEKYGYPKDFQKTPEGAELVKTLREAYLAADLPNYMKLFTASIAKSGGPFLCGSSITLADICWLPRIRYLQKGVADHISKDCLAGFPEVLAWETEVMKHPAVAKWYGIYV
jgi:glutathione S-transferase